LRTTGKTKKKKKNIQGTKKEEEDSFPKQGEKIR
jgi:hypothetical protein